MYRLLRLYKQSYDASQPVVCMDEKSKQLLQNTRTSLPAKAGRIEKYDHAYKRKGTCNLFVAVTDRRTKADFAYFIEELITVHFPKAACIQWVLDNLNTHFKASLVETFGKVKANRLLKKIRFIYTPKHASWLNMAEIEINIMDKQCRGGRIESKEKVKSEVKRWTAQRNKNHTQIEWKFTKQDADKKLAKYYVS